MLCEIYSFATYTTLSEHINMTTLKSIMSYKNMKTTGGYSSEDYRFNVYQGTSA